MTELKILIGQRTCIRSNLTKEFNKPANSFTDEDAVDQVMVQASLEKLKTLHQTERELSEKIVRLLTADQEISDEISKASEFEDAYLDRFTFLKSRMETYSLNQSHDSVPGDDQANVSSVTDRSSCSVKLPKLEISKFDGDPARWQEFWDSFEATIHNNVSLSAVDKFKYLKGFLEKDAFRLADGSKLTAANYDEDVECLQQRYGNPEIAIFQHFEQLLAISVASNDFKSLQDVYDHCERHIRSLEALGISEDTFGRVFTPIILSKLPKFVRIDLHRQNGLEPWSLAKLRKLLKTEIQVREMSQHSFGSKPMETPAKPVRYPNFTPRYHNFTPTKGKVQLGTASSLVNSGPAKKPGCPFCFANHDPESCRKYPTADSRRQAARGKCFICFKDNHKGSDCRTRRRCKHCGSFWHHTALCTGAGPKTHSSALSPRATEFAPQLTAESTASSKPTHMQTAIACISSPPGKFTTTARLIFDTASSRTYISSKLCKQLAASTIGSETVSIAAFGARKRYSETCSVVSLDVSCKDGSTQRIEALVTEYICRPVAIYPVDFDKYPSLRAIGFAESPPDKPVLGDIDVLVGGDFYYKFVTGIQPVDDDLVLINSRLGFLLAGRASAATSPFIDNSAVCMLLRLDDVDYCNDRNYQLERFWNLEEVGIKEKSDAPDDEIALSQFNDAIEFRNGRYHVRWPWKVEQPDLPSNFALALGRLKSLLKRIKSDKPVFDTYTANIKEQEKRGIIERVDISKSEGLVHYLPHHCVVKPERATTKVRIVYDASAKANKHHLSLNDCLHRGPVILTDLCGLLIRFRLKRIGVISDLEKAFMQIALKLDQRDVTRFLWVKDPSWPLTSDNIIVYRFCRVLFGVISSPFILAATIAYHLQASETEIAKRVSNYLYVDNIIAGTDNFDDLMTFYQQAKGLFQGAAMNLREWYSNDEAFMNRVAPADRGTTVTPKVLGLQWHLKADTLSCPSVRVDPNLTTKRQMLQCLARLYDPCGFFSPITVAGRILLQELWRKDYEWDERVPDQLVRQWQQFATSLSAIHDFSLPRIATLTNGSKFVYELHCFCDASAKAYAAAIYLLTSSGNEHRCHLIFAKSRVAPIKPISIPRLELLAVFIGAKILSFVKSEIQLPISRLALWSDSSCALSWIKNDNNSVRFVANRVKTIRQLSSDTEFYYVPTKDNPADLASRGCAAKVLFMSYLWWNGPEWLCAASKWPDQSRVPTASIITDSETSSDPATSNVANVCSTTGLQFPTEASAIEPSRFSSFIRLLRVTAWVFRFIDGLRRKEIQSLYLSVAEIRRAKMFWIKRLQSSSFPGLLDAAVIDRSSSNLKRNLGLFVDTHGLIRCRGRIINADVSYDAAHPILLPNGDKVTDLIIQEVHVNNCHAGVTQTLAQSRYSFWIPKGRSQVKRVLSRCVICRKAAGMSYRVPVQPPLPDCRVARQDPFATTGLDYIGPLYIKVLSGAQKVWICIFTCAVIRAVHLEVVIDLTAHQFLLSFRRFIALYGAPVRIISDNASQLHASHRALLSLIRSSVEIQDFSATRGIEWNFLPELAPWMGGFYERLVATVKGSLRKSLGKMSLSLVELQTVVAEITSVINSRPLTYISGDELKQTICPNDFLARHGREGLPLFDSSCEAYQDSPKQTSRDMLIDSWKRSQKITDEFWNRWHGEYLLSLCERSSKQPGQSSSIDVQEGSVVLVKDHLPKGQWKLGRIASLLPSKDGLVRSAVITLANRKQITRPIKLLCPVEVSEGSRSQELWPPEDIWDGLPRQVLTEGTAEHRPFRASSQDPLSEKFFAQARPKRQAAVLARQRIEQIANDALGDSE